MIRTNVKQPARRWKRRITIASALMTSTFTVMTFVSGCESDVDSYCVSRCNCQGCSQRERADCLDDVEDAQRLAEHDGCAAEISAYLSCYADEGSCMSGAWVASTCSDEGSAIRACSARSATFIKSACAEEKDKREACGLTGGGSDPCTGADECSAYCALAASCDELANPQPDSPHSLCVVDCTSSSSGGS